MMSRRALVPGADRPLDPSRRRFLKAAGVGVGTAGVVAVSGAAPAPAAPSRPEHARDLALLVDVTRCIGCGSCVAACKLENGQPWRDDQPALGPDAALASANRSVVRTAGSAVDGEPRYVKTQCLHCLDPACVSACFVRALTKADEGPVLYDGDRCVGCRYCLLACPFSVPTFEWDETFGRVGKCELCWPRTSRGGRPACAEACPTGALTFGRRGRLLVEAWRRVEGEGGYVRHVYGQTEVGGTSVLYVSDVPFEELGFRTGLPDRPLPGYTWEITRLLPPIAVGLGATLIALWRRRMRILEQRDAEGSP